MNQPGWSSSRFNLIIFIGRDLKSTWISIQFNLDSKFNHNCHRFKDFVFHDKVIIRKGSKNLSFRLRGVGWLAIKWTGSSSDRKRRKETSCVAFWYCHTRRVLVSYFQWWNFYWDRFCFLLSKMLKMWFDYQDIHFGLKFVPNGKILWTLCMDQPARTSVGLVGWTFKDVRHQPKKGVLVATVMDWLGSSTSGCLRDSLKRLVLFCIFWMINILNGYGMVWIYPFTHDANVANAGFGWDSPQGLLGNWSQC